LPGLTRQPILFAKKVDAWVKPAHDKLGNPKKMVLLRHAMVFTAAWQP
jgi:hypothetical protein